MEVTNHHASNRLALWVGLAIAVAAALAGVSIWLFSQAAMQKNPRVQLQNMAVSFPMFYPQKLPVGFNEVDNSVNTQDGVVMFSLTKGDTKVIVSQQPRPKVMEEVNKLKDVTVPVGKAYIATLNERTAGFLVTDKTLIVVSAAQNLDPGSIEVLLQAMAAL